jgi:hypothetical protein
MLFSIKFKDNLFYYITIQVVFFYSSFSGIYNWFAASARSDRKNSIMDFIFTLTFRRPAA